MKISTKMVGKVPVLVSLVQASGSRLGYWWSPYVRMAALNNKTIPNFNGFTTKMTKSITYFKS